MFMEVLLILRNVFWQSTKLPTTAEVRKLKIVPEQESLSQGYLIKGLILTKKALPVGQDKGHNKTSLQWIQWTSKCCILNLNWKHSRRLTVAFLYGSVLTMFTLQQHRKISLSPKNKRLAFSQLDFRVLCENTHAQSAVRKIVFRAFLHKKNASTV